MQTDGQLVFARIADAMQSKPITHISYTFFWVSGLSYDLKLCGTHYIIPRARMLCAWVTGARCRSTMGRVLRILTWPAVYGLS